MCSMPDTPLPTGPAVQLTHPDVELLTGAPTLYEAVLAGRWSVVADLCSEHLSDPAAAAAQLERLGETARTSTYYPGPGGGFATSHDAATHTLTWHTEAAEAARVLDLFSRVWMGQWGELVWTTGAATVLDPSVAVQVRGEFQIGDLWPVYPAYRSIASSSPAARLAYSAYCVLDRRPQPTFTPENGRLQVDVVPA